MNRARLEAITANYSKLRIAVVGDFCLDRYLEIDPDKTETSIETGLPVHNVVRVRAQPGGAGTILNNLSALGVGTIWPVGFAGDDGEGFELRRALSSMPGVELEGFIQTGLRRTFTYCKPLLMHRRNEPQELSRLDSKNWSPTPMSLQAELAQKAEAVSGKADAVIVLDQVDEAGTGVVTPRLLETLRSIQARRPGLFILADSRRGLASFPPLVLKMNAHELSAMTGGQTGSDLEGIGKAAIQLARRNGRQVFVTLSERGMLGSDSEGRVEHVPALPLRGPIDVVGAGDAVSANLCAALAGGAGLREALELANAAASVVVHKLGTTGTATAREIQAVLR